MRRGDKTGGKTVKTQRRKTSKRRNSVKVARRRGSSAVNLQGQLDRRTRDRDEALEQQAATADILSIISNSPTDTQPVFDAIVQSGLKLFPDALISLALRYGDTIKSRGHRRSRSRSRRSVATHNFPYPLHARVHARCGPARSKDRGHSRREERPGRVCRRRPELPDQRLPSDHDHAHDVPQRRDRPAQRRAPYARTALGQADCGLEDVRRAGRHRYREHSAA